MRLSPPNVKLTKPAISYLEKECTEQYSNDPREFGKIITIVKVLGVYDAQGAPIQHMPAGYYLTYDFARVDDEDQLIIKLSDRKYFQIDIEGFDEKENYLVDFSDDRIEIRCGS